MAHEEVGEMDAKRQLLEEKWAAIEKGFKPGPGWEGPFLLNPETVADLYRRNGLPVESCWQIIVCQQTPDARNPDDSSPGGGGVQAALAYTDINHLLNTPTEIIVRRLALSIAGRAAHEALEWATMNGKIVVDPHGTSEDMDEAAALIREYLGTAVEMTDPPQVS